MTGFWPENQIDHINGARADNRFTNLREATNKENSENIKRARRSNKSTEVLGVYTRGLKFRAQITHAGKIQRLGTFKTAEEAHQAYLTAKRDLHLFNTL